MKFLVELIVGVLRILIPALVEKSKSSYEDAHRQPELKNRLSKAISSHWILIVFALPVLTGCFVRTIYVPHGEPVRLRENLKDVKVWVLGADGKPVEGELDLREGWYVLSDPGK